ncbi:DUF3857 domain-containing protein [Pedobacter yulinensis]|uniref:DUF3857 domain-containing protein n=1 Tax=Pedobacter yulinensis TaxID=2126353 RepID=A0A2T3HL74_9SPHI|nr:DUF3857 and transglutaminase domain-containing protein [Pedobacter yulinensis]PST83218.1 DUF3857 domain-containing protein [Pedobacter yulinensis]
MKKILLSLFLGLGLNYAHAQDFDFGLFSEAESSFDIRKFDAQANAAVLNEYGTAKIDLDASGNTRLYFTHHLRIKILNQEGFDEGNITIPLRQSSDYDSNEEISEIVAATFNPDLGVYVRNNLDPKKIYEERANNNYKLVKFTFPNLKPGSVIEYSYKISSPRLFNFHTWEFQSNLPKRTSSFVARIPAIYNYNVTLRGPYKLSKQDAKLDRECLSISGVKLDCSRMTYTMDSVPAFREEEFMTAATNFKSAIYFELSDYQTIRGVKMNLTKTWRDIDYELKGNKDVGGQMKRADVFKEAVMPLLANASDPLQKAKIIYAFISKNIRWNNYRGFVSDVGVKKAFETHTGNTADINYALISALTAAGLDAEAVILSTRSNGTVNKLFPVLTGFDYVVAKLNIADKTYLLDATDPLLPFGLLPIHCINDQGRVISLKKPSEWIDLKATQRETVRYVLDGDINDQGKLMATLSIYSNGYAAHKRRKQIKSYNSLDEYVEKYDERMTKMKVLKYDITNLDTLDLTLSEVYHVEMDIFQGLDHSQLYLNPFILDRFEKNPFNLDNRTYPVDLGAQRDTRILCNIRFPGTYTLVDKPKDLSIALPEKGGRFLTQTAFENGALTFSQMLTHDKSIYDPQEYASLKEFYSRIIQLQKTDIVLKKTP